MPYKSRSVRSAPRCTGPDQLPAARWARRSQGGERSALLQRIEFEVGSHNVAAVTIEPIKGERVYFIARPRIPASHSGVVHRQRLRVFIADEIQTGFGRTGAWFAHREHEVESSGRHHHGQGIAGGFPLAAVTGRSAIMDAMGWFGRTYGGNPVACAAALRRDPDHAGAGPGRTGTK